MRLLKRVKKVKGKEYEEYRMSVSKREACLLQKLGNEFVIDDVDEKSGKVWLKSRNVTTATFSGEKVVVDPVCSFRVKVSGEEWRRFKGNVRGRGLTVCGVVSDVVRAFNLVPELVESPGGVKIVNVFLGKPRSRFERKLWEERVKEGG